MIGTPLMYVMVMLAVAFASNLLVKNSSILRGELKDIGRKYPTLGGLRGILAFSVFVGHSQIAYRYYKDGAWSHANENFYRFAGTGSVAIFFMITGLLFWGKVLDKDIGLKKLFLSRISRIMPLYLFSLIFIVLASLWMTDFTLKVTVFDLAYSMLLWLLGGLGGSPEINGVSSLLINCGVTWTLQYEWLFYISLPFLAMWSTAKKFAILVMLFLSIILALKYSTYSSYIPNLIVAIPFIYGMLAAYVLRKPIDITYYNSKAASWFVAGSFMAASCAYAPGYSTIVVGTLFPAFVLVAGGNSLFGLLEKEWIRWLGEISFSVYLIHGIILMISLYIINMYFEVKNIPYIAYILISCIVGVLVVIFSSVSYIYIERPFMKSKRF